MATLTGQTIASSYEQLLSLPNGGLNGATLVAITDGDSDTACALSVATTSISIGATHKLYLDAGGNTYIHEVSADKLDIVVGGQTILELSEGGGGASDYMAVQALNKFYLDGSGDTYIQESATDIMDFYSGGVHMLSLDETNDEVVINEGSVDIDFRVESNGNLNMLFVDGGNDREGIGTAAPDGLMHIVSSAEGGFTDGSTAVPQLVVEGTGTTAGSTSPFVVLHNSSAAVDNDFIGKIAFTGDDGTGDATGDLSAGTEYASIFCRILDETDNSTDGQLYISTDVDDAKVDTIILSGGNVGIGTTPTTSKLIVRNNDDVLSATANVLHVMDNHATVDAGDVLVRLDFAADGNVHADLAKFISFHDSGGEIGYIATSSDGVISTSILSDVRLKTNIKDTSIEGLNVINALKVRDFKWNNKANSNQTGKQVIGGWVADEVYEVYPKAVHGKPGQMMEVKDDNGNKTGKKEINPMGVSTGEFISVMMKAIQELSASNDALKARIEVLEG